jgi:hypothetical protein
VTEIEKTIECIDSICAKSDISYTIIGGIANIIHGSGRTTQDIDVIIQIEIDELQKVYDLFTNEFIPLKEEPVDFFKNNFVLPLRHKHFYTRVDVSAALSEFERNAIQRSSRHNFGRSKACYCSPEDLILFKLVAKREQDVIDVNDIINRHKDDLDVKYLFETAKLFSAIDRHDIYEILSQKLKNQYDSL